MQGGNKRQTKRINLILCFGFIICVEYWTSDWVIARPSGWKHKYSWAWGRCKACQCWAECRWTACSMTDLDGWFAGNVRDQEVHGNVLAVYVLVHHVPDGLGHHVGVQIGIVLQKHKQNNTWVNNTEILKVLLMWTIRSDLVEESCSCQDHGELTGVVGVVEPRLMVDVPCVVPPRETHNAISGLSPHSARHRAA